MHRVRQLLARLGLVVLSLFVALAFAEGLLRLLGYHGPTYLRIENTTLVDDPVLNWRFTPDNVFYFNNVEYRINDEGFRDTVHEMPKPAGVFRVLLASDSIGYGVNVQAEDSYPKVLESLLNERCSPPRFEVANLGMPGLSLSQKLHLVEMRARDLEPDLVLIDYCMNDPAGDMIWRPPKVQKEGCTIAFLNLPVPCRLEELARRSAFLFALRQRIEEFLLKRGKELEDRDYRDVTGSYYVDLHRRPQTRDYLETTLTRIHDLQQRIGVPVFMPIFPILYRLEDYRWAEADSLVAGLCARHGIAHLSLLSAFRTHEDRDLRIQRGDFLHPSVMGHRLAAEAILTALETEGLVPPTHETRTAAPDPSGAATPGGG
jgi:hypothetical protein